jgi:hypothetical protein
MSFSALASGFSAKYAEYRADILRISFCLMLKFRSLAIANAVVPKLQPHVLLKTIHMFYGGRMCYRPLQLRDLQCDAMPCYSILQ